VLGIFTILKYGTEASGNWGHEGRPGQVGGSGEGGEGSDVPGHTTDKVENLSPTQRESASNNLRSEIGKETYSKEQAQLENVFGEKLAMEFRTYSDISQSPEFTKIGAVLAKNIEATTGNKVSTKDACDMVKGIKAYAGNLDQYKNIRAGIPPEIAKAIERLIKVSPKFDGKIYRGMSFPDNKFVSQLKVGAKVDMKGLSSWSSDKKWATQFSGRTKMGVIFEMKNKSGASITHLSKDYREKEVLIPSKSNIVIDSIVEKNGVYYVKARES
jgi:hypothetical protein